MRPPYLRLRIEVDGHVVADFAHPVLMVAIGNGSRVGGGAVITPGADPTDGRMTVMVSYSTSLLAKVGYAARFRTGTHTERDDVLYAAGERGHAVRPGLLLQRRRRALRPRAQPLLARRAGGVLDAPA